MQLGSVDEARERWYYHCAVCEYEFEGTYEETQQQFIHHTHDRLLEVTWRYGVPTEKRVVMGEEKSVDRDTFQDISWLVAEVERLRANELEATPGRQYADFAKERATKAFEAEQQ
jgi:monoamine oxidase